MAQLEQLLVTDSTQKHGSVRATIDDWFYSETRLS